MLCVLAASVVQYAVNICINTFMWNVVLCPHSLFYVCARARVHVLFANPI